MQICVALPDLNVLAYSDVGRLLSNIGRLSEELSRNMLQYPDATFRYVFLSFRSWMRRNGETSHLR
jgi:hypothetical protein